MHEFRIGDIVRYLRPAGYGGDWTTGRRGTVVSLSSPSGKSIGVDFGDAIEGHDLDRVLPTNTGWYCWREELELVTPREPEPLNEWWKS